MEELLSLETEKCLRSWTWQLFENAALDKVTLSNAAQFNPRLRRPEGSPLQTIRNISISKRLRRFNKDWNTNAGIKELLETIFHTDATFDALCTLLPAQLNSLPPAPPSDPSAPPFLSLPPSPSLVGGPSCSHPNGILLFSQHDVITFFSFYPYGSGAPGVWEGKQGGGFNEWRGRCSCSECIQRNKRTTALLQTGDIIWSISAFKCLNACIVF